MKPKKREEKFAVPVIGRNLSFVGRQNWKICKSNFLLLARSPYHRCDVHVTSKAINQGNG